MRKSFLLIFSLFVLSNTITYPINYLAIKDELKAITTSKLVKGTLYTVLAAGSTYAAVYGYKKRGVLIALPAAAVACVCALLGFDIFTSNASVKTNEQTLN